MVSNYMGNPQKMDIFYTVSQFSQRLYVMQPNLHSHKHTTSFTPPFFYCMFLIVFHTIELVPLKKKKKGRTYFCVNNYNIHTIEQTHTHIQLNGGMNMWNE